MILKISIKIITAAAYFLLLYLIAVAASWNRKWGEDEFHFLGISYKQWRALLIMWFPVLILFVD